MTFNEYEYFKNRNMDLNSAEHQQDINLNKIVVEITYQTIGKVCMQDYIAREDTGRE